VSPVKFVGVDDWLCAVHNEPVMMSVGKMTCVKYIEHYDLEYKWVSKSRTREISENGADRVTTAPMYIEGDNGMVFKHKRAGWWPPDDRDQRRLHRLVFAQRGRLGIKPTLWQHLITRRSERGFPVFDVYGPTYAGADSSVQPRMRPVRFGITESVRTGRARRTGDVRWEWVEGYRLDAPVPAGLPPKEMQKLLVQEFWLKQDLTTTRMSLTALQADWEAENRGA
jgi:hypothetical protein